LLAHPSRRPSSPPSSKRWTHASLGRSLTLAIIASTQGGASAGIGSDDIEAGNPGGAPFMGDFFGQVADIKRTMENVRNNITELEDKQSKALTDVYGGGDFKQEIEDLTDDTNAMSTRVRNQLKELAAALEQQKAADPGAEATSDFKIRRNMHATLTKKFMETMQDYQDCQTKYKNKYQETVKRQFKIVKPDATQDEVDQVLEGGGDQIFTEHMLASRNAQARAALEDVQEKHKDIQRLESSIQELHQLFVDLSVLVESQGELLDTIEYSVSQSLSYTKTGVQELEKANEYAAKSRKKMCILIVIFMVVLVFVAAPMLF
jgi:t-SNARE complex subunit (syntaxin)